MPDDRAFDPVRLGEYIRRLHETEERRHFVTLLFGAGCSRSAGIPLAGEIVQELRKEAETHPLLKDVGDPPKGVSEYAFLMGKLGSPIERAKRIKRSVDRARDKNSRLKINWSHLLLAALVEKDYVNRILTTNFDPLIVEAMAITGQPIRTYDLNTTGKYHPGTLDPASVIYLHGQMHSLFLANSKDEMERVRCLYPAVLQEAVQNSLMIVVGYSGDCDPVLESLEALPNFPLGIWWSHYSRSSSPPGDGFERLFRKHGSDCHLCEGEDSDTFMRKVVLDGMKLGLPDEVLTPITATRISLERITPFPTKGGPESDPVDRALEYLRRAEAMTADSSKLSLALSPTGTTSAERSKEAVTGSSDLAELSRAVRIAMAVSAGDWKTFDELQRDIRVGPASPLSQAVGDGLLVLASVNLHSKLPDLALAHLDEAERHGVSQAMSDWLPTLRGDALAEQAKLKGGSPEADRLFGEAGAKYQEALRIKPDLHEALNNWGNALLEQAKLKGATSEADRLFGEAGAKYQEVLWIKPSDSVAHFNLACIAALVGDVRGCAEALTRWIQHEPNPTRARLDAEKDFDRVRETPEFQAIRDSLPP